MDITIFQYRYLCNRMVYLYTQIALETDSFTVSEHKTKIILAFQMLHIYFSKLIHNYNTLQYI